MADPAHSNAIQSLLMTRSLTDIELMEASATTPDFNSSPT